MANTDAADASDASRPAPDAVARSLVRTSFMATLATLDRDSGHPYASLAAVATASDGSPLLLLSTLALHTRNLEADPRTSLLFEEPGRTPDALTRARVTLIGRAARTDEPAARRRYLARHPAAEMYADFADFGFWRLDTERAHLVAGFGRIQGLAPADILLPIAGCEDLAAAEPGILAHMNADHADAIRDMAAAAGGDPAVDWRMAGCDPEGIDLVAGGAALRVRFVQRIATATESRRALIDLVEAARQRLRDEQPRN